MKNFSFKQSFLFATVLAALLVLTASNVCVYGQSEVKSNPIQGLEKSIFLDLRDINVVDVIKFLGLEGDLNIVTSKNVQGRSTLLLHQVTIKDALDIISISNQLAYHMINGIIYVMTEEEYSQLYGKNFNDQRRVSTRTLKYAKPTYAIQALQAVQSALGKVIIDEETGTIVMMDTDEKLQAMNKLIDDIESKLETQVIKLQYAEAKVVEAQLKARLDAKAVGSVIADERSNQIIISAYPDRMKEVLEVVKALDKENKAVLVEARILQITINPKYDYGIDWEKSFTQGAAGMLENSSIRDKFPINSTNVTSATGFTTLTIGDLTEDDFIFQIKALKQVLSTKLLANPRLMILNKQESKINIGDRIPYVITTTTGTGNNASISEDIRFIDVGLQLAVTPTINDDGFITMKIRPEISSQTGEVVTPTTNKIPKVNTSYIESTVVIKDGTTVVIGGLRKDALNTNDKGIQYLMDVPLLGELFKSRSEETVKTELAMFLTPKIVSGAEDMTDEQLAIKPARI